MSRTKAKPKDKSVSVVVPAQESVSRSMPAAPALTAQVSEPAVPPRPYGKMAAPSVAPVLPNVPRAKADPALAEAKRPDSAVDVAVPGPKPDHLSLAREAFNARDWVHALDEGKRAVAAGGGAEAHAIVGNTYYKMGRFVEAEQAYTKAVAIEPSNKLLRDRQSIAHARAAEIKMGKEP